MRFLLVLLTLLGVCGSISVAQAGSVIERVKACNVVRCGSVERPGLARATVGGRSTGLYVEVGRAIAATVLYPHP